MVHASVPPGGWVSHAYYEEAQLLTVLLIIANNELSLFC